MTFLEDPIAASVQSLSVDTAGSSSESTGCGGSFSREHP